MPRWMVVEVPVARVIASLIPRVRISHIATIVFVAPSTFKIGAWALRRQSLYNGRRSFVACFLAKSVMVLIELRSDLHLRGQCRLSGF